MEGLSPVFDWLNDPSAHTVGDFTQVLDWDRYFPELPLDTTHGESGGYHQLETGYVPGDMGYSNVQQWMSHEDADHHPQQLPGSAAHDRAIAGEPTDAPQDIDNMISDWLCTSQPEACAPFVCTENATGQGWSPQLAALTAELSRYVIPAMMLSID